MILFCYLVLHFEKCFFHTNNTIEIETFDTNFISFLKDIK